MPINIIVGLFSLLVALISYSIACWGAFRSKSVTQKHVTFLWVGVFFDVLATVMMAIQAKGLDLSPKGLPHTVVALLALVVMILVALLAARAKSADSDAVRTTLAKWILAPWVFWIVVFLWGMAVQGSARMGG